LPEPAATHSKIRKRVKSSAPYSSSVTLIYVRRVSAKLPYGVVILQRPANYGF
jgi:hypothetical protein